MSMDLYYVECPQQTNDIYRRNLHIIRGHNAGVGLGAVRDSILQMWYSTRSSTGDHAWTPHRNVDLATFLGLDTSFQTFFKDNLHT